MTYEEAIKILHPDTTLMALAEVEYFGGFKGKEAKIKAVDEACVIAYEALEKQIPKKPKRYIAFDGIERNGCPACSKNEILYAGQKFCSVCGQAIDWSVIE